MNYWIWLVLVEEQANILNISEISTIEKQQEKDSRAKRTNWSTRA